MMAPVSVCHHVSTIGARSPPMTRAVPHPRLGVDRLADATRAPAATTGRTSAGIVVAPLHERADRRRRRVEDRHLVLLDDLPPAALVRGVRRALVHHLRRAVGHRSVDDVRVAGHPADVGGAPVDVGLGVDVVHDRVRVGGLREVPAGGVEDALRLPGRPGRVEDEERVLGLDALRLVGCRRPGRARRATRRRGRSTRCPARCRLTTRTCSTVVVALVARAASTAGLRADGRAAPVAAVGGDDDLRLRRRRCGVQSASAENPPKTTECGAPSRAHASIATAASGIIGR